MFCQLKPVFHTTSDATCKLEQSKPNDIPPGTPILKQDFCPFRSLVLLYARHAPSCAYDMMVKLSLCKVAYDSCRGEISYFVE